MFGIGLPELIFILALALIVLGPDKLPGVARQIARFVGELKRAADELKNQVDLESLKDIKSPASWERGVDELEKKAQAGADLTAGARLEEEPPDMEPVDIDQRGRHPGGLGPDWKIAHGPETETGEARRIPVAGEESLPSDEAAEEAEAEDKSEPRESDSQSDVP